MEQAVELPAKIGRPSGYSSALAAEICERVACGEPVRQICLLEHMPNQDTVYCWLNRHSEFAERYARAKEAQAERFAEELQEIADDGRNDWIERENSRTGQTYVALSEEAIARSRLRVETRKWLMSKFKPKKYGERIDVDVKGEITHTVTPAQVLASVEKSRALRDIEAEVVTDKGE